MLERWELDWPAIVRRPRRSSSAGSQGWELRRRNRVVTADPMTICERMMSARNSQRRGKIHRRGMRRRQLRLTVEVGVRRRWLGRV